MNVTLRPWGETDLEIVRRLMRDPSLVTQFEGGIDPGELERLVTDPFFAPELCLIASVDAEPVGFSFGLVLPGSPHRWTMMRIAVIESHGRRGIGGRMYEAALARLPECAAECRELCLSAWEPCPPMEAFALGRGFALARHYWKMERGATSVPKPQWPPDVRLRTFDGSAPMLADWNDVYNASFAAHYHFVPSTLDTCRALAERPGFENESVLLAYAGPRCIGFCRCEPHDATGEIALLGVIPEAQGRGLGRALLRAGARWLTRGGSKPVTLMVDGENDGALALYRSEGFDVVRTRSVWSRAIEPPGAAVTSATSATTAAPGPRPAQRAPNSNR